MIVTTTGSIDGHRVVKYFRPILVSLDSRALSAALLAAVAGAPGAYLDRQSDLLRFALDELERRAAASGANGVVGTRIEVNEITGGAGFWINAVGTPVLLKSEQDFADALAHEALIAEENAIAEAERQALIKTKGPLAVILADPRAANDARDIVRNFGAPAAIEFLNRKLTEYGVPPDGLLRDLPPEIGG